MNDVLYLKHRPETLEEVVGNENVISVLKSYFEGTVPFPRSILFHGPTGCGKTTLGRIIATQLGAVGDDLKEIDSADFRGIDTIREIRKKSMYAPLNSPCRIWILDEIHKATNDAQSALLKALEDTPSHIYYILCTTEPQKLLPAIRGRCSQFQVEALSGRDIKILLRKVVKSENEKIDKTVYDQIAQDSFGYPRNALQILSQVLAVDDDKRLIVAKKSAETQSKTIELCRALMGKPWGDVAIILKGLKGEDPESIRRAVLGYYQSVILNGRNDVAAQIMDEFIEPFYNSGFPQLVLACYSALFNT